MFRRVCLLAAVILVPGLAGAQVVETSKGTIEFVGLEAWTPERIQAALGYETTDQLHYCAGELKKRLGFPDAAVFTFTGDQGPYKVITVVEPAYAARVVRRPAPDGDYSAPSGWEEILAAAGRDWGQDFVWHLRAHLRTRLTGQAADLPDWSAALARLTDEVHRDQALARLANDRDRTHRIAAAAVLGNFSGDDDAWRALMAALRDREDMVVGASMHVLEAFAAHRPRRVDWRPSAEDIRHILNGTSLFATRFAVDALLASRVDPSLAPSLMGNRGGRILLAYLDARWDPDRARALRFLRHVSGRTDGPDAERWRRWIDSLSGA